MKVKKKQFCSVYKLLLEVWEIVFNWQTMCSLIPSIDNMDTIEIHKTEQNQYALALEPVEIFVKN